ncbi:MAG: MBL fold metallo-hydrolase [Nanoarchaeota archaeon]|nr:MBL fold metallo-hydrolase [Nanoarchaeota archaeon]
MQIKGLNIDFLGHSGFLISNGLGKKIAIDPYNISDNVPKVDFIIITHSHYDHCSIKDIAKIARDGTTIIIPADAQSKITKIDNVKMEIIEIGDELEFNNIKIEALPAYNIKKEYHPKGENWLGYLIKINGAIIYHAGDTDRIPEMEKLTGYGKHGNEFIALLPISGTYVMDAEEASEVAKLLSPDLAIPMHYGSGIVGTIEDAEKFVQLCEEKGIKAKILEKI